MRAEMSIGILGVSIAAFGCGTTSSVLCWNAAAIKQSAESVARTQPSGQELEREMADISERADLLARYHGPVPAKLERATPEDNHMVARLHALVAQREHKREIAEKIRRLPVMAVQAVASGIWSRIRWPVLIALGLALSGLAGWCWHQWRHVVDTERTIVRWLNVTELPKDVKRNLTNGTVLQQQYRRMKENGQL